MRGALLLAMLLAGGGAAVGGEEPLRVGSKKFTESVILGDTVKLLLESDGHRVEHKKQLGGSRILFDALESGEIDVYPEYTGTLLRELLADARLATWNDAKVHLRSRGIGVIGPLGFNNTYALGMKEKRAASLGIRMISDLREHAGLKLGFTNEFMQREDGWPGLRTRYDLPHEDARGMDHDMAYRGLGAGEVDVMDCYSTDAEIVHYGLRTLEDDLAYFPSYQAVLLYRVALETEAQGIVALLSQLAGRISADLMRRMNAGVKIERRAELAVAAELLEAATGVRPVEVIVATRAERVWRRTKEHLLMTAIALTAIILLGLLLGVAAAKVRWLAPPILGFVGLIWTVPALGLFYVMMPVVGLYEKAAITALLLYGLLPVVRNTQLGITTIAKPIMESAHVLGLSAWERLRRIELPLAAPSIFAGIKSAVVITVGTATIGAIIGAGGYGQPILTGIRRDDMAIVLEGLLPAMGMALVLLMLTDLVERLIVSPGLRLKADR